MELTPEEKNRIYAEEKARREALAKIKEEEKQKEKQNNEEARKKGSQICLKIIAFITITWLLYYPTKALLSAIFLSDTDLARVSEIEQLNANIDRDKSALWDVGMKDAGRSIHYLSYPRAYDNVRTISLIVPLVIAFLVVWYISRTIKNKSKTKIRRG